MPINPSESNIGLNLNNTLRQVPEGQYTFALNAVLSGFDGQKYTIQNEQGNEECVPYPEGFTLIGKRNITERNLILVMLANDNTGESEIGTITNCTYTKLINDKCLN